MSAIKLIIIFSTALVMREARYFKAKLTRTASLCDTSSNINDSKILCYCIKDLKQIDLILSADCFLVVKDVEPTDPAWDSFEELTLTKKISLTNLAGIALEYIPTDALKRINYLVQLDVYYENIEKIHSYAFGNISNVEKISIVDSKVKTLENHAIAHHRDLKEVILEKNNISEINRDVFIDLPSLKNLSLTGNQITAIQDKAFANLNSLKTLKLNMNKLFSVNNETFNGLTNLRKLDLSKNNLKSIGENSFYHLKNLVSLNLHDNKIMMLREGAFNGLNNLRVALLMDNFHPEDNYISTDETVTPNSLGKKQDIVKFKRKKKECSPWGIVGKIGSFALETVKDAVKGEISPHIGKVAGKVLKFAAKQVISGAKSTIGVVADIIGFPKDKISCPVNSNG